MVLQASGCLHTRKFDIKKSTRETIVRFPFLREYLRPSKVD